MMTLIFILISAKLIDVIAHNTVMKCMKVAIIMTGIICIITIAPLYPVVKPIITNNNSKILLLANKCKWSSY